MRRSSRTPWAGPARRRGCSQPGTGFSNLRALPSSASAHSTTREAPCVSREFASGLAPFLLPPPGSGAGTGGSGLLKEPPFDSGGRPRPGRLAHPGLGAHGASSSVYLSPRPAAAAYARRRFFFLHRSRDGQAFLLFSASPLDGQPWADLGLGISAPSFWRGDSSPSDLCSAASFYAVQLPCSCFSLSRPLQGLRLLGFPVPGHRVVPGAGRSGAVVGAEGAFT